MLIKTHLNFSLFIFLLTIYFTNLSFLNYFYFGLFIFLGTIIVDIDTKNSFFGRIFIFRPLQWFISHRGIFHSLFFALITGFFVFFVNEYALFGYLTGFFGHLLLDMFTSEGVKLFWPLYKRKMSFFRVVSGGIVEQVLFVLLLLCNIILVGKMIIERVFLMI